MLFFPTKVLSKHDKELISYIYKKTYALLFNVSFSMLHSNADAEDAVSTTYIKIMSRIKKINKMPRPKIIPYCVKVVKNTAIDMLRNRKRVAHFENIDSIEDVGDAEEIWKHLEIQDLTENISRLNEKERHIITLHYGNGFGYAKIATFLGINEESAKKRGQRALKSLKKIMEEHKT